MKRNIIRASLILLISLLSFSSCSSKPTTKNKTILISGFEAFGGDTINPTEMIVNELPKTIKDVNIHTKVLPVEFIRSQEILRNEYDTVKPDAVIMLGQAGGRSKITPETTARNNMDGVDYPDNAGYEPNNVPVVENGPDKLKTRLPIDLINAAINSIGVPSASSNNAGEYVCNCIFYSMLHYVDEEIPTGFIHVPFIKEQGHTDQYPYLEYQDIYNSIIQAIKVVANTVK